MSKSEVFTWYKHPHALLEDPRILEMEDHQQLVVMRSLSEASRSKERGIIPPYPLRGLAAKWRTTLEVLKPLLELLCSYGMIELRDDGAIIHRVFIDAQYDYPSDQPEAALARQHKSRGVPQRSDNVATLSRVVTNRHESEQEVDRDLEIDQESVLTTNVDRVYARETAVVVGLPEEFYSAEYEDQRPSEAQHMDLIERLLLRWRHRTERNEAHALERRKKSQDAVYKLTYLWTWGQWRVRFVALDNYLRSSGVRRGYAHYPENWLPSEYENWLLQPGAPARQPQAIQASRYEEGATSPHDSADEAGSDEQASTGAQAVAEAEPPAMTVPATPDAPVVFSPWIAGVVSDWSRELGEPAAAATNIKRGMGIWQESGLSEGQFVDVLQQAKKEMRLAQGGKRPPGHRMGFLLNTAGALAGGHSSNARAG